MNPICLCLNFECKLKTCGGVPLIFCSWGKYKKKSGKCHLYLSGVTVLCARFNGSAANSQSVCEKDKGRWWETEREKEKERDRDGATERERARQRGRREGGREREGERRGERERRGDRQMIDGAKKPISCFIWSALLCNQQTHAYTPARTHTHT